MAILFSLVLLILLLYFFVPKGFSVYEGLRFPAWTYRMKKFPSKGLSPKRYEFGEHRRQYLIHYTSQAPESTHQQHVVVYIHGGGWQFGKPEMFSPNAQLLDQMGYHSFFLSHRRLPRYNIDYLREDVASGMSKVLDIMQQEGMSHRRIILGGVSSGANLAALLYFDHQLIQAAGLQKEQFAGLFLLAPPLNLKGMWHSPTLWWLVGKRESQLFKKANPIEYLDKKEDLPMLVVHPEKDGMVPLRSTQTFIEKAETLGFEQLEFHILEEMTHMDAASWCFRGHLSHEIIVKWLKKIQ